MRHYETSFFIEGTISAEMGVNAIRIHSSETGASPTVSMFYPKDQREKYERIAAFINEVMAEDDTADQGLVEAIAAE